MHQRSALEAGKDGLIHGRGELLLTEDEPGARAAQRLVRGGGDDVGVLAGIGMQARGDQARDMRHVHHEQRAHRIGDLAEAREIQHARISAGAGQDHLGLVLLGQARELVVIDALVVFAHAVGHDVVSLAGEVELVAVGQVAAVREVHAQDGVAGLQHRGVSGLIGLRAGMRLHVGVLGAEQLLGAVARQVLHDVGELASAVVAFAGIAFGVLVGEDAAGGFQHRFRDEVLAGDQLQLRVLALGFVENGLVDVGVHLGERPGHPLRFGGGFHSGVS